MSTHIASNQKLDQFLDEQVEQRQMEGMLVKAARLRVGQMVALLLRCGVVKQDDVNPKWWIEAQDGPTARFIAQARSAHGDKYIYEKTVYEDWFTKLTVTCPKHGDWQVSPQCHFSQRTGCPTCGGLGPHAAVDTPTFIAKARAVHGDKYIYDRTEYKGSMTYLTVSCPKHGDWRVAPRDHLYYHTGCPKCAGEARRTPAHIASFIDKAKAVHGDQYTYDGTAYVSTPT